MKVAKKNRGQFVIIAVMLAAIMIISIGAVMHNAATYYKNEPWEEYTTLVSNIELSSQRLLELSLNPDDFANNFYKWQADIPSLYPGAGIKLTYTGDYPRVTFTLNITSIGLAGYKFTTEA
jgi:hypothetical protein